MKTLSSSRHTRLASRSTFSVITAVAIVASARAPIARADVVLTVDNMVKNVDEGLTVDFKFTLTNNTTAAIDHISPIAGHGDATPDKTDNITSITFDGVPASVDAGASKEFTETIHTDTTGDGTPVPPDPDAGITMVMTNVQYNSPALQTNTVVTTVAVIDLLAPEVAPGPMAGALALLVGCVLSLTDRCRRL